MAQARALKQVLPRQQAMQPLFEALQRLDQTAANLPSALREQLRRLLGQLPSAEDPALRERLRQAMLDSGLFAESRLLQRVAGTGDIKIDLLRLLRLVNSLLDFSRIEAGRVRAVFPGCCDFAQLLRRFRSCPRYH